MGKVVQGIMKITEVRIKLAEGETKLLAYCTICLENTFVINDVKIIQGTSGPFVAMPSRQMTDRCQDCQRKNHLRARYCNYCGIELAENRAAIGLDGKAKLFFDVAHPVTQEMRDTIEREVLGAYKRALEKPL